MQTIQSITGDGNDSRYTFDAEIPDPPNIKTGLTPGETGYLFLRSIWTGTNSVPLWDANLTVELAGYAY